MLVIMKALLSGYNIDSTTIHEARNAKVLCLFAKAAYLDLFIFCTILYNMPFFSMTNINHGSRRPRPRRVVARHGRPVAQKIATGLLYRRPKVWTHEFKRVVFKIASR